MYKQVALLVLVVVLTYVQSVAQSINNYQLTEKSFAGSLRDMTGSKTLLGSNISNSASAVTDLGFSFVFMGKVYNKFSVNTNGVLRLGDEQVVPAANTYGIPGNDRIVPMAGVSYEYRGWWWWNSGTVELATLSNGKVHYKTVGTSPNRSLIVEWKNVGFGNSATTFQVRLHESVFGSDRSGKIEFVYDQFNLDGNNRNFEFRTGFGIGPEDGNFVAVDQKAMTLTATQNYLSTVSDNNNGSAINATDFSGGNASRKRLLSFETPKKPAGQFSRFAEICKGINAITISFEENCPDEAGIAVYRKLKGQPDNQFNMIKSLGPDSRSISDGNVTTGNQYVYRFHLLSEGKYADTYQDYTTSKLEAGAAYQAVSSGNWTNPSTWGNHMPTSNDDVVIGCSGSMFITMNGSAQVNNLTIEKGSFLTIEDGFTLSVKGDFINNGVFNPIGNAQVIFNGHTQQAIINNGQGITNNTQLLSNNTRPPWSNRKGMVAEKTITVSDTELSAIKSVTVDLTHNNLRDITLQLVAPSGQVFMLSNGRGQNGDNYDNVTFVETGQPLPARVQNVNLSGAYRPEESFSSYTGPLTGTWRLQVRDGFGNASGSLNTFSMVMSKGISNDLTLTRLTINNNSSEGIVLQAGLHVQRVLQLNQGIIHTTKDAAVFVEAGANANEGNNTSFIDGPMYKQGNTTFTFPVGDQGKWSPVTLKNFENANNNTVFIVEYFKSGYGKNEKDNGITSVSESEYWDIEPTAGNPTVDISLYWKDALFSKITSAILSSELVVAHYTNNKWVNEGGVINLLDQLLNLGHITARNVSTFSPFTFGSEGNSTLPVELLSFGAIRKQEGVLLNWETASEQDNSHFEVQRSSDYQNWSVIATVQGSGTSQSLRQYVFLDANALQGENFYRLKQVDFDENYEYSKIAHASFAREAVVFSTYPNPATDYITVKTSSYPATVELINEQGIVVAQQQIVDFQTMLHFSGIKAGIYMLKLSTSQETKYEKIVFSH